MSLINQMLRDLDARRAAANPIDHILRDLAPSTGGAVAMSPPSPQVALAAALLLCVVLITLVTGADMVRHQLIAEEKPAPIQSLITNSQSLLTKSTAGVMAAPITANTKAFSPASAEKAPQALPPITHQSGAAAVVTQELRAVAHAIEAAPQAEVKIAAATHPNNEQVETPGSFHREEAHSGTTDTPALARARASNLIAGGNSERGLSTLQAYLREHPTDEAARLEFAEALLKLDRPADAQATLREGLALQPQPGLARLLGHLLYDRGDVASALRVLQTAAPALNEDPDYYAFLAALYQRVGDYQAAVNTYHKLLTVQPQAGNVWLGLGISLVAIGDEHAAADAFAQASQDASLAPTMRTYAEQQRTRLESKR